MASNPSFASTPRLEVVNFATANTNRDGTGTIATLITGVAAGTRINEVIIEATGTTTAGVVRLFVSVDNGSTWRLYDEILVTAITPSTTLAAYRFARQFANLILRDASCKLGVSTHNAETFNAFALAGDLT